MAKEDASALGFDPARLAAIVARLEADVAAAKCDGVRLIVSRHGKVALDATVGFADREKGVKLESDSVFCSFSLAKQFTNTAVLKQVEKGNISLTAPVADVIPEFAAHGKGGITVAQLITHRAGMSSSFPPVPPEQLGDIKAVVAAVSALPPDAEPGSKVNYSPTVAHFVLAELVRRLDGGDRTFREILAQDVFAPLDMKSTSLGMRADLASRRVPVRVRDRTPGLFPPEALEGLDTMLSSETCEIPGGGCFTTAGDVHRFAEAIRQGGASPSGARVLSPAAVRAATTNQTGDMVNHLYDYAQPRWPPIVASLGMGFFLRGTGEHPMPFGSLASPGTFGGLGAGSNMFWVDPATGVTCVFLSAGLMEEINSMERHQRYSDMVHAAVVG